MIVLINGNWEQVKDLSDVVRIVKENIGDEFAREVERICRFGYNNIEKLKDGIYKLEGEVEDMENDYDDISQSLDYLNE